MSIAALDNLVKIRQLAAEPRNETEIRRLLRMAQTHLADAQQTSVSVEGRYLSAYAAGHSAGLAALRHHGYRSENRYIVFQSLTHTLGWPAERWRLLDAAHRARNLAEYEGFMEVELSQVTELTHVVATLLEDAQRVLGIRLD
ncbi:MAG: hypothetical protein KA260_03100 [Burkholderiales bacterium]|nr:hypothetical protein [Burkholderiales bacterium]